MEGSVSAFFAGDDVMQHFVENDIAGDFDGSLLRVELRRSEF